MIDKDVQFSGHQILKNFLLSHYQPGRVSIIPNKEIDDVITRADTAPDTSLVLNTDTLEKIITLTIKLVYGSWKGRIDNDIINSFVRVILKIGSEQDHQSCKSYGLTKEDFEATK